jgi:hypothetical protein
MTARLLAENPGELRLAGVVPVADAPVAFLLEPHGREFVSTASAGLDIAPVITHRFPADRFEEAFAAIRTGETGKVLGDAFHATFKGLPNVIDIRNVGLMGAVEVAPRKEFIIDGAYALDAATIDA